jgi:formylglycine-generating enzyme required for sulfatase activity
MRSIVFVPIVILMVVFQSGFSFQDKPKKVNTKKENIQQPMKCEFTTNQVNFIAEVPANQPKVLTNSLDMKLVLIPKGKFMMGSPPDEKGSQEDERRHEVTISRDYHLGMHEVTQAQYKKIMGKNPSAFQGDAVAERHPETNRVVKDVDSANHPVEQVSWEDAVEFCQRLSALTEEKKAGRIYRLPSEAEWEYACLAGTTTPFHFGSQLNGKQANCNGTEPYGTETKGPYLAKTTPVGKYPPNGWGLYDMHGNVWEWCADWYGEYPKGSATDPRGPEAGSIRVFRGGSWYYGAVICRSAGRYRVGPSVRGSALGFRVALSSSGIPK